MAASKKVIRIIVLILTVVVVLSWVAAFVILHMVFGRRDEVPVTELRYDLSMEEDYPRQQIEFSSDDSLLYGWLYDTKEDRGLIIVANGFGAGADSHLPEIRRFVDEGFRVLTYDGTGIRRSGGDGTKGLTRSVVDLENAVGYVKKDDALSDLQLFIYGHSAGGYAAAICAEDCPEVDGIICVCAFDEPAQLMLSKARKYAGFPVYLGYPAVLLRERLVFKDNSGRRASDALGESKVPALIIAGSADDTVPYEQSIYARKDEIDDPDAVYVMIDTMLRNTHNGSAYSVRANNARLQVTEGAADPDIKLCNELDEGFMDLVVDFYNSLTEERENEIISGWNTILTA